MLNVGDVYNTCWNTWRTCHDSGCGIYTQVQIRTSGVSFHMSHGRYILHDHVVRIRNSQLVPLLLGMGCCWLWRHTCDTHCIRGAGIGHPFWDSRESQDDEVDVLFSPTTA